MADRPRRLNNSNGAAGRSVLESDFPSPRYFQVHFEYLDHLLLDAAKALEILRTEVAEVYRLVQAEREPNPRGMNAMNIQSTPELRMEAGRDGEHPQPSRLRPKGRRVSIR